MTLPHNREEEQERLEALRATGILDTPPDHIFDALTQLAADLCDAPLAFVSLVDADRLWFKSHIGSAATTMPRERSLCGEAVSGSGPLVVGDLPADPRFAGNPYYEEAGILAYAGVPLITRDGWALGTLCVLDTRTRDFTDAQLDRMRTLAAQVVALIELHQTRRTMAEGLREEHEERLRVVLDGLPDGVVLLVEGRILYHNPAALALAGDPSASILGRNPLDLIHPGDRERLTRRMQELMAGGALEPAEYRAVRMDGACVPIEVRSRVIDYQGGKAILSILQDLTRRKEEEEARRRLELRMQEAQRLEGLGILAGGIAHEFNNLLTSILGHTNLAQRDLDAGSRPHDRLERIEAASQRAAELCRQMLTYAGHSHLTLEPVNLNELVGQMRPLLDACLPRNASLVVDLEPALPHMEADPGSLGQLVLNLATNAADALPERGGTIRLRTMVLDARDETPGTEETGGALPAGRQILLEVEDDGCGMDSETRRRLFDPFFTTKYTGRGLGMAAAMGIVRAHHGEIEVESAPGKGTRVRVRFPLEAPASVPAPAAEAAPAERDRGTVLVVDDEAIVRTVAREVLEEDGFTVLEAGDGIEALERFREDASEIVAVILDLTMPRMGGEEAFRRLRKLRPELPVIFSSGYDEQRLRLSPKEARNTTFVQKPYSPERLREKLDRVLPDTDGAERAA